MPPKKVKRPAGAADVKTGKSTAKVRGTNTRSKNNGKAVRGRGRGALRDMLDMPIDIIQEILQHFHPRDLLSLSWVSKSFHAFLMRKGSAYIWKRSLKSVHDLPPCPDKLIEPAWVTFMFSTYCTGCGSRTTAEPYWTFYARFCKRCGDERIISDPVWKALPKDKYHIRSEIPTNMFNQSPRHGSRGIVYLNSEVQELTENFEKALESEDEEELARFIGRQILHVRKTEKHACLCSEWVEHQVHLRDDENAKLEMDRLQDIISRLRSLGWGPELAYMKRSGYEGLLEHEQVKVPKKLTDRAWQNMREGITDLMQGVRDAHPDLQFTEALSDRLAALQGSLKELVRCPEARAAGLTVGDIALMPEVRDIMSSPASINVGKKSLTALRVQMGEMIERWRSRTRDDLRNLLARAEGADTESAGSNQPNGVDPLELATTMFSCKLNHHRADESEVTFYPNVLQHGCLRARWPSIPKSDVYGKFVIKHVSWLAVSPTSDYGPFWAKGGLVAHRPSEGTLELIKLCGKDPTTVTAREMDAMDLRFVQHDRNVMTWRAAMLRQDLLDMKDCKNWRLARPEEVAQARECEEVLCRSEKWTCAMCRTKHFPSLDAASNHLKANHDVEGREAPSEHLVLYADSRAASGIFKVDLQSRTASTVVW